MWHKLLAKYKIVLASKSPRRQQFLIDLGIPHEVHAKEIDESYPDHLQAGQITEYIAQKKAAAFAPIPADQLLITSDTIVWDGKKALGKPNSLTDAVEMLANLSGKSHQTISSICITNAHLQKTATCITDVWFKNFTPSEIQYYVENFKPMDKAGSYGIQEWIGMIGVHKIEGSFYNVMGLPTHLLYQLLCEIEEESKNV